MNNSNHQIISINDTLARIQTQLPPISE
uniref:Uncharacterized protein n=1 Tax=Arundo donax TaxID=35708 RepID=A0A0A9B895_ARUDO